MTSAEHADEEGSISVQSAVLRQVLIMADEDEIAPAKRCHLDVHLVSTERWQMFDFHTNEALPPYDGRERVQESTWRFEGIVAPPTHQHAIPDANWKIAGIV